MSTEPDRRSSTVTTIVAGIVLVSVVVGVVLVFALRPGTEPAQLLAFLGGAIIPALPAVLAATRAERAVKQVSAVAENVANVSADVADVKVQTNGALHALVEQVQAANGNPLPSPDRDIQQGQEGFGTGRHSSPGGS